MAEKGGEFVLQKNTVLSGRTDQFLVEDLVGRGGFGQVLKCQRVGTDERAAIKVIKEVHYASAENEVRILKLLREFKSGDSHIVRFLEHFESNNRMFLVFELLDINLYELMRWKCFFPWDVSEIRAIAQQMLAALKVLKELGVTHRDMKCDNVMLADHVMQPLRVKLIDFGLSSRTCHLGDSKFKQPLPYRSPDVILDLPVDEAIDMWGLGCILAFLYLGRYLFPHWSEYETLCVMIKLLGQPHDSLLTSGNGTDRFFKCVQGKFTYSWRLKTVADYYSDYREQIVFHEGAHTDLNSLDDLQRKRPKAKDPFEKQDLLSFIDLLKQILDINPLRRITPLKALDHEFITMSHLAGATNSPYVTVSHQRMVKDTEEEKEAENAPRPGPSQLLAVEESLEKAERNSSIADSDRNQKPAKNPSAEAKLVEEKEQKQVTPVPSASASSSQVSIKPTCRSDDTSTKNSTSSTSQKTSSQKTRRSASSSRKATLPSASASSGQVTIKPTCRSDDTSTSSQKTSSQKTRRSASSSRKATLPSAAVRKSESKRNNCQAVKPKAPCTGGFCGTESSSPASCTPINSPSSSCSYTSDDSTGLESQISTDESRNSAALTENDPEEILQRIFDVFRSNKAATSKSPTRTGCCGPKKERPTSLGKRSTDIVKTPAIKDRNANIDPKMVCSLRVVTIIHAPPAPGFKRCAKKPEEKPTSESRRTNSTDRNTNDEPKVVRFHPAATVIHQEPLDSAPQNRSDRNKPTGTSFPSSSGSVGPSAPGPQNQPESSQTGNPSHFVQVKTKKTYLRRMKNFFTRVFNFRK